MTPRFLFLLTEGLEATVIDSQVADTVLALREEGLPFDILSLFDGRTYFRRREYYKRRQAEIAERTGARVVMRPIARKTQSLGLVVGLPLLAAELGVRGLRRSVIHARGDWAARFGAALRGQLPGVRLVYDCRGDGEAEFRRHAADSGERDPKSVLDRIRSAREAAVRGADHTLCVSTPLREVLVERHGLDRDASSVVPCAADERKFRPDPEDRARARHELGLTDRFVVVYPGRFGQWHYSEETMRVIGGLLEGLPDAYFLGLTPDLEPAEALARRHLPAGRYRIQSAEHREIPSLLRAADLGVLLRERDPLNQVACPTKFAEFMMSGLPVLVSSEIGDCSDFVAEHDAGVVLAEPNPDVAKQAVLRLREDWRPASRARIASAGQERFSRQRYAKELVGLYRRLASSSKST